MGNNLRLPKLFAEGCVLQQGECSGQSNMELPMNPVRVNYPEGYKLPESYLGPPAGSCRTS